ncbi:alpha-galactosidase [Ktedonospora formicarum]|uniref:Alpha-galactosidase n=1 Tax=Ktedonospora formicarum TaxID=2778364 RepID=A0A8J3I1Z1_9CHLR|nr:alpha-galactosidase [Ktedonospora formicarum]GHO46126.1 alpha-galactosidase [Ktedonospora formicarum]
MPIHTTDKGWVLETKRTGYALGFNEAGLLTHCYWGPILPFAEDYPTPTDSQGWASFNGPAQLTKQEYPGYAGPSYIDPCLKVTFNDGVRDVVLRLDYVDQEAEELTIHLRDTHYPFLVTLHYRIHADQDLIERWATITNEDQTPIALERIFSAQWHLPQGNDYRFSHLNGRWLDETHLVQEPLQAGLKVLESRRLTTSHHHNPWFAIDRGQADEDAGEVWFGLLAWSGNWKLVAEVTEFASTRLSLGINDWDFAWKLNAGESFTTPSSYAGYTREGFGGASRHLHDFVRETLVPHAELPRQVLYNSWEATMFDVDEQSQLALARQAAALGIELFVMDDGWFHKRNLDNAGLGDWWPDEEKFPHGLEPLIQGVNALGMDFGLWVEPEMVNPDSDLYRNHPDWVIHFPTRTRSEARNQLILNMARPDVQEYLIEKLDHLLTQHNIRFIKWDMNRNVSEPGWPDAPGDQRELWVRYVQGLYYVWGTLRARHPEVRWQSCSGGGGRADLGILGLADQIWVSDNTEATARLGIQEGFSQVFPASTMEAWVTDANPKVASLAFRFHASMCGVLGIGANILHWNEGEREQAKHLIAQYKEIRPIVQFGDLYRLRSPQLHAFSALEYMTKDRSEGALFAFRTQIPNPTELPLLYLRGLDPEARYRVEGFEEIRSGQAWMNVGLQLTLDNFESTILRISKVS